MTSDWKSGGCFCGYTRYSVRGPAIWKAGCTCATCVKVHAAPYVVWAGFDRDDFVVTKGNLKGFPTSPHVLREFCDRCGTSLTYRKIAGGAAELEEASRIVYVAVATLDDPTEYPPDEIVHGAEKIDWLGLDNSIPIHEFISPDAGRLQFGGLDQNKANFAARTHIGKDDEEG